MQEDFIKKFSPGKLLLSLLIRHSIAKKLKYFDFGYGEEFYKKNWSNKEVKIYSYIKLKRARGIFLFIILKLKQIIKSIRKR